ncbi:MAG TPA: FxsB family cyclophane-forming radical SAM/SPASM peptide maturase [Longimicrobium sp.]|nr:FxsB family cyclophane-forming radical SAM/SPASM peptide maturase [Longimicrobium sp.]
MIPPSPSPVAVQPTARFCAALLKVASRCNLNCDYCYVYQHADSSWRAQPKLMSEATARQFGLRLDEYVAAQGLDRFSVIFHGGEPLLYSAEGLARLAGIVRGAVRSSCALEFSLQTNGVLLTEEALGVLAARGISVSLSLDGPRHVHDRHRLNHAGESTFDATLAALRRLRAAEPGTFSGVIAVIDASVPPRDLFEYFAPMDLPRLDFLLPDATHAAPPAGRSEDEDRYRRWLEEAFELWFREYPQVPIRWFDAVLGTRVGVPSPTDVMGFGNVSLIVIETDGSYTDHDVFKITGDTGAQLGASVFNAAFSDVAQHPKVREHGHRLTFEGLAAECMTCPVVEACGGGCVMHRAHPERGLEAPTVYCGEMFGLLGKATELLRESLSASAGGGGDRLDMRGPELLRRCVEWRRETEDRADEAAGMRGLERRNASAAAILLPIASDAEPAPEVSAPDPVCVWLGSIRIQASDPRLMEPFLESVRELAADSPEVRHAVASLDTVEECLRALDPHLPGAMAALLSDIIFVESTVPDEGGIFSFSDDKAPNVLYVAAYAGGEPIAPDDLADSIYHEFRHQVLYHYERSGALLFDRVYPRFPAPWRPGLRQSSGFLHGTFVFTGLAQFWAALADNPVRGTDVSKAGRNAARATEQAAYGIRCLREFALLTPRGMRLIDDLADEMGVPDERMQAPGLLAMAMV